MRQETLRKLGYRTAGLVFLAVIALLVTLSVRVYQKAFDDSVMVTLRTDRVGNQLDESSEVKARGVVVGEVRDVAAARTGAAITLAMYPSAVDRIPESTRALLVPKTLFGERYVQLTIPDGGAAPPLSEGDVITQDRSDNAVELQQVFNDLLPVLKAVQPQKLATMLTSVSTALSDRGEQTGNTLAKAADYLERFNPNLDELNQDIRDLAEVSRVYGDVAPDLLEALTDASVTLNTAVDKRAELDTLYSRVTASSRTTTTFLRENKRNMIQLAAAGRAPLEVTARYAPSFPCTLSAMVALKPSMDKVLGAGPRAPGMHLEASVTEERGGYEPGKDDPAYTADGGPRCYPSGVAPRGGTEPAPLPETSPDAALPAADGLGLPNSAQERQVLAPLVAPEIGVSPGEIPEWSSALVGPLYRGTEVTLR